MDTNGKPYDQIYLIKGNMTILPGLFVEVFYRIIISTLGVLGHMLAGNNMATSRTNESWKSFHIRRTINRVVPTESNFNIH